MKSIELNSQQLSRMLDKILRQACQVIVHVYQMSLGLVLGGACRFEPSCSCYALDAFKKKSFSAALKLVVVRLLKCRPFGPSGFDPVPDPSRIDKGSYAKE